MKTMKITGKREEQGESSLRLAELIRATVEKCFAEHLKASRQRAELGRLIQELVEKYGGNQRQEAPGTGEHKDPDK